MAVSVSSFCLLILKLSEAALLSGLSLGLYVRHAVLCVVIFVVYTPIFYVSYLNRDCNVSVYVQET